MCFKEAQTNWESPREPSKTQSHKKKCRVLKGTSRGRISHACVIQLENNMAMRREQKKASCLVWSTKVLGETQ